MNKNKPRIIFMGTPDFSVPVLTGLIENYKVIAVVTQPDKPVGRSGKLKYSPVKETALKHNIEVLQPKKITEVLEQITTLDPDLIITCAYGKILPKKLLETPKLGCINVHASLLPKLRGGAPIHHAIIDGYKETGITIMYMSEEMDAGDIISQEKITISDEDTTETLHDKLSQIGRTLLLETLPSILNGTNQRIKQDASKVTFGYVITREDEKIDFHKTKTEIINQIRGLNSHPGAYCLLDNKILKVWKAIPSENSSAEKNIGEITNIYENGFSVKVGDGEIIFTEIQPEGKSKMKATNFINGHPNLVGKVLK